MFSKEECACLDDKVGDDERDDLLALFKAALKATKTGKQIEDSSPEFQKGMVVLNKYQEKCSK
jgi:hypothetical protein